MDTWSSREMFLHVNRFLSKMFAQSIAIFMPIFICMFSHTRTRFCFFCFYFRRYIFQFAGFQFQLSTLCYVFLICVILTMYFKIWKQMSKSGFFLSWSHIGRDSGFSSKIGRILMRSELLDSLGLKTDVVLYRGGGSWIIYRSLHCFIY